MKKIYSSEDRVQIYHLKNILDLENIVEQNSIDQDIIDARYYFMGVTWPVQG